MKVGAKLLFALVISLIAYEWQSMASDLKSHQERIRQNEKAITEISVYQKLDAEQQKRQIELLEQLLIEQRRRHADELAGEEDRSE